MVIVDTNVIIDHLRLNQSRQSSLSRLADRYSKETLCLSIVSVQELHEGKSTKNPAKENDLLAVISSMKVLPYNYEVARLAGEFSRDSKNNLGFVDAAIAATSIINGCQLLTLNKKDFRGIKDLSLLTI